MQKTKTNFFSICKMSTNRTDNTKLTNKNLNRLILVMVFQIDKNKVFILQSIILISVAFRKYLRILFWAMINKTQTVDVAPVQFWLSTWWRLSSYFSCFKKWTNALAFVHLIRIENHTIQSFWRASFLSFVALSSCFHRPHFVCWKQNLCSHLDFHLVCFFAQQMSL